MPNTTSCEKNKEIRIAMVEAGIKQYQLADMIGVNETVFSRWMRKEMTEERKNLCLDAIKKAMEIEDLLPNMPMSKNLLTIEEVANFIGASKIYVVKAIRKGYLPAMNVNGAKVRKVDLDKFLEWAVGKDITDLDNITDLKKDFDNA